MSAAPGSIGLLVMAYGTPASVDQVEEYYLHIRRGRPPTAEQLDDLVRRYRAIGGTSPLRQRTDEQLAAVRRHLADPTSGRPDDRPKQSFHVVLGQKHAAPLVEDGVEALVGSGVERVVGLVLAPHYSASSVGAYHQRASAALAGRLPYAAVDDWSSLPEFITFTARSLNTALAAMPERTRVFFTAHSLPLRLLAEDPYEQRLHASADAIATEAGLDDHIDWRMGWQSAGRTPEPWAGPDILEEIERAGEDPAVEGVLVVPQGFTSDHLEVLYDLDIEARAAAGAVGLAFARSATINADDTVMAGLARLVDEAAR